jgi:hypothetical protein
MLNDFCVNKFNQVYTSQEQRDTYRVTVKSLPHLADSPTAGGATAAHSASLAEMIQNEEKRSGKTFSLTQSNSWANTGALKLSFDRNSKHPGAINAATQSATTPPSTSVNPTSTVPNSNDSLTTGDSGSTLAPATQATSSGRTFVSQDLSSVISQMQSMASAQTALFEKMLEKQDQQNRRAVREAREIAKETRIYNDNVAKETRRFNQETQRSNQEFMAMMIHMMTGTTVTNHNNFPMRQNDTRNQAQIDADELNDRMDCNDNDDVSQDSDTDASELSTNRDNNVDSAALNEDSDDFSTDTAAIDFALRTTREKHANKTRAAPTQHVTPVPPPPPSRANNFTQTPFPSQPTPHSQETIPKKSPPKSHPSNFFTMSPAEAIRHASAAITNKKKELAERDERKQHLLPAPRERPVGRPALPETNPPRTPTKLQQDGTPVHSPAPPSAPKDRTRRRSPGHTPDNETKMQRTGRAPLQPTTQDEVARALDYEEKAAPNSAVKEPDPPTARSKQE